MKKTVVNPIRYKTFVPSFGGFIGTGEKALGAKLVTVFQNKDAKPERVRRFVGTSETKDRDGEIALISSWDFTNYVKNPVVLWMHNHGELPLGKTVGLYKDEVNKLIYFDIELSESYEFAKTVDKLVEEGVLSAVSVGFRVLDWTWDEKADALVFTKTELFEISIVNVPANQDALVQDGSKGAEEDVTKSVEFEQVLGAIQALTERVDSLASRVPEVKQEEVPPAEITPPETPPLETPVEKEPNEPKLDEEGKLNIAPELLNAIVEAVQNAISQSSSTAQPEPQNPSPEPKVDEPVIDANTEPEPVPQADDATVVVRLEDLDEAEGFVILNEEEN